MTRMASLRQRLFILILTPLLAVAIILGFWRFNVAQSTAEELFDRGLLSAALAISRDVANSEGDALSPRTRTLISDAGGGEVFYHVTGPGGIYVTGYAYPPAFHSDAELGAPEYRFAEYRGEDVRVLRMAEAATIGSMSGQTVVTVWQRLAERQQFVAKLAWRAFALIGALMATLAIVVWFGVQRGLRPLNDLQEAIERRTPDDLSLIRRQVPEEVLGIVATLNRLLGQVAHSIQTHQAFISDAAHQLRNPASALLSLAESLPGAKDPDERRRRERMLISSARRSARLAEQLLSMDRLRYGYSLPETSFDPVAMAQSVCTDLAPRPLELDIDFSFSNRLEGGPKHIRGDSVLLAEALRNLIENALQHGGSGLTKISVALENTDQHLHLVVCDNGIGLPPDKAAVALSRFGQVTPSTGSGLGLAIVDQVLRLHGGDVHIDSVDGQTRIALRLPLCSAAPDADGQTREARHLA